MKSLEDLRVCIGCGKRLPGRGDEHQSGDWCIFGDCKIKDFNGVNRLLDAFRDLRRALKDEK